MSLPPRHPRLDGRVAIVTGANTGIGLVTARELAALGAHVFVACRSEERTRPAIEAIRAATKSEKVEFLPLDLGDLAAVRASAKRFLERGLSLSLLVNNAGLASQRGLTRSGFELAFGTNHVGHFLFTQLLLDRLVASGPARIVTVASRAHYQAKGIDWAAVQRPTRSLTGLDEYAVSKLANVLFSSELAHRLEGTNVTTYSLHPGVVASDIWRRIPWPLDSLAKRFMISTEEGAATSLHCACSPEVERESGLYYDALRPRRPSRVALDAELGRELWRRSEAWVA